MSFIGHYGSETFKYSYWCYVGRMSETTILQYKKINCVSMT